MIISTHKCCEIRDINHASVPWTWGQIGVKLGTKDMVYQKLDILCKKEISMLTALKVSSLACKHVLCRPKQNAKRGPYGIEF